MNTYRLDEVAWFRRTKDKWGEFSNMCSGFPLEVNGHHIIYSEAIYQALKFPDHPDVQREIIEQKSPIACKMKSRKYNEHCRPDWMDLRVRMMAWSLKLKLLQNWDRFSAILLETEDLEIVEFSTKDNFWGAKPQDDDLLVGHNVLGKMLTGLREKVKNEEITPQHVLPPLDIEGFTLYGQPIQKVWISPPVPTPSSLIP